ncbi:MAG: dihydrolipoyl dehydrogenase [Planctomycetia bacterium]|nr:dihydrolipoyl dehydrogenase [Planctomycetia bacterium]
MNEFDLIVIGGGPGGYVAAIRASQLGLKVALIEKRATLGGTCLNVGCIPSKALLDSSEAYHQAKSSFARHGVQIGDVKLDLGTMMARKDSVVKGLTQGVAGLMKKNKVTVFTGIGKLVPPSGATHKVQVGEQTLSAPRVLLATGSEPTRIPTVPFDGKFIVDSTGAIAFDKVPKHLIVIGGGYIGLELGSVWARLGSKVTVLEFLPRIFPLADAEIADAAHKSLMKLGLTFQLETKVESATVQGNEVVVKVTGKTGPAEFRADKVLVAVGRRPYSGGLGLTEVGVKLEERTGVVPVNEDFETNIKGIYAIGDLIPGPMLAHKAEEDGVAFAERLKGIKTKIHYDRIPSVIYIWPEIASVGPTEEEVKKTGREYRVGKFPLLYSPRAKCMDEAEGMVKVLADAKNDKLLAVHIFGPRASDMIAEAVAVMEFGGSAEDIGRICHAHPTLSEALKEAALGVDKRAIHM